MDNFHESFDKAAACLSIKWEEDIQVRKNNATRELMSRLVTGLQKQAGITETLLIEIKTLRTEVEQQRSDKKSLIAAVVKELVSQRWTKTRRRRRLIDRLASAEDDPLY